MIVFKNKTCLILFVVCLYVKISYSEPDDGTRNIHDDGDFNKTEETDKTEANSIPESIDKRFFNLGGFFPGFNQAGTGGNVGINSPSNTQFYPSLQAQVHQIETVEMLTTFQKKLQFDASIFQNAQGILPLYPNQGSFLQQPLQNQVVPSNNYLNQQGSLNNINQSGPASNQSALGNNPMGINGNLIISGGNSGQNTNLANSNSQQNPLVQSDKNHGLIQGQGQGYPIQQQANYPNQGEANFIQGQPGNHNDKIQNINQGKTQQPYNTNQYSHDHNERQMPNSIEIGLNLNNLANQSPSQREFNNSASLNHVKIDNNQPVQNNIINGNLQHADEKQVSDGISRPHNQEVLSNQNLNSMKSAGDKNSQANGKNTYSTDKLFYNKDAIIFRDDDDI